eukprot:1898313-Rhodomonas_salina.1
MPSTDIPTSKHTHEQPRSKLDGEWQGCTVLGCLYLVRSFVLGRAYRATRSLCPVRSGTEIEHAATAGGVRAPGNAPSPAQSVAELRFRLGGNRWMAEQKRGFQKFEPSMGS